MALLTVLLTVFVPCYGTVINPPLVRGQVADPRISIRTIGPEATANLIRDEMTKDGKLWDIVHLHLMTVVNIMLIQLIYQITYTCDS